MPRFKTASCTFNDGIEIVDKKSIFKFFFYKLAFLVVVFQIQKIYILSKEALPKLSHFFIQSEEEISLQKNNFTLK